MSANFKNGLMDESILKSKSKQRSFMAEARRRGLSSVEDDASTHSVIIQQTQYRRCRERNNGLMDSFICRPILRMDSMEESILKSKLQQRSFMAEARRRG